MGILIHQASDLNLNTFKLSEEGHARMEAYVLLTSAQKRVKEQGLEDSFKLTGEVDFDIWDPAVVQKKVDRVPNFNINKCRSKHYKTFSYPTVAWHMSNLLVALRQIIVHVDAKLERKDLDTRIEWLACKEKAKLVHDEFYPVSSSIRRRTLSIKTIRKRFAWYNVRKALVQHMQGPIENDYRVLYTEALRGNDVIRSLKDVKSFLTILTSIFYPEPQISFVKYQAFFEEYLAQNWSRYSGAVQGKCRRVIMRLRTNVSLVEQHLVILDECIDFWNEFPFVSDYRVQKNLMKIYNILEENS